MGVALMTSRCGWIVGHVAQRAPLLNAKTMLLVDDDKAQIANATVSWISAVVPTTMSISPLRRPANTASRSLPSTRPVSKATFSADPSGLCTASIMRKMLR